MKIIFLLISIFAFIPAVCLDNSTGPATSTVPPDLIGSWDWVESNGGIAGVHLTPENTGNTQFITLTEDSQYLSFRNDSLIWQSPFRIVKVKSIFNNDSTDAIYSHGMHQIFEFSENKDSLFLAGNVYDGFAHTYTRILDEN